MTDVSSKSDPVSIEEAKPDKYDAKKDGDDSTPPEKRK